MEITPPILGFFTKLLKVLRRRIDDQLILAIQKNLTIGGIVTSDLVPTRMQK